MRRSFYWKVALDHPGEPLTRETYVEKTTALDKQQLQKKLMTFDLRFDTLSEYLSNFAMVINQHAGILNALYEDSTKKATKKELAVSLRKPGETFDIVPPEFSQQVTLQLKTIRPVEVGESLEDKIKGSSNLLSNRMDQAKVGLGLLFNQNQELFERLEKAEYGIRELNDKKADLTYLEQKNDRLRAEMFTKAEEVQSVQRSYSALLPGDHFELFQDQRLDQEDQRSSGRSREATERPNKQA